MLLPLSNRKEYARWGLWVERPEAPWGHFFCSVCGGTYARGRPPAEADKEFEETFKTKKSDCRVYEVCDDCYTDDLKHRWRPF